MIHLTSFFAALLFQMVEKAGAQRTQGTEKNAKVE
jgi:hypothetical protein